MFSGMRPLCGAVLVAIAALLCQTSASAQDAAWQVSKSSGDVSVTASGAQQVSLTEGAMLKAGDSVRTGQTGRVLLTRGAESILISPNSVIEIPIGKIDGMSTTIIQRSGSILLDVEKRNVKHFEVQTPYLAAVVKGTKFRVTVGQHDSNVSVLRGQVEVSDFKSGQYAMVMPGQAANVAQSSAGLSLSGSGTLNPIQQGSPRPSPVEPLTVAAVAPDVSPANEPKAGDPLAMKTAAKTSQWNGRLSMAGDNGASSNSQRSTGENLTLDIGVTFGIGLLVAVTVAAQRRRQRQKQAQRPM